MRQLKYPIAAVFISTVYAANWALTHYGIIHIGFGLLAPAGVFFAGLGFLLRCALQEVANRLWVIGAILAGAALSYWLGASTTIPGGHVQIAIASACAFLFSELADWSIYTPLRTKTLVGGITAAQVVGATVDSLLFLWLAFGNVSLFWGQFVGKTMCVLPALVLVTAWRARQRPVVA